MRFLTLLAALVTVTGRLSDFYHTTDSITRKLNKLSDDCHGATLTMSEREARGHTLPVVDIAGKRGVGNKKMKVLFYFGEHARELISPETALEWAHHLCGKRDDTSQQVSSILEHADIRFYPVVNPSGRKGVEQGDWCKRTNENDVDLNRNWNAHWGGGFGETNSGPSAFSEVETQMLKKSAESYKPDMFVTVHSGVLGMYTPHAYSLDFPRDGHNQLPSNVEEMVEILRKANSRYCNCDTGAAGKEVGYLCPGTCLDYMYDDLSVPYSFAFEIYERDNGFKRPSLTSLFQKSMKEHHDHSTHEAVHKEGKEHRHGVIPSQLKVSSCFLVKDEAQEAAPHADHIEHRTKASAMRLRALLSDQTKQHAKIHGMSAAEEYAEMNAFQSEPDSCFYMFNPSTQEEYDATVDNWSKAFLEIIDGVIQVEKKKGFFL